MHEEELKLLIAAGLDGEDRTDAPELDAKWDALAAGTLSSEERAELQAAAENDPRLAELLPAFRPLGSAFEERTTDWVMNLRTQPSPSTPTHPWWERVQPWFRPTRWVPAMALAAAVLVMVNPSPQEGLPPYAIEIAAGDQMFRSEAVSASSSIELSVGSALQVVLRPESPVNLSMDAATFHVQTDGTTRPIETELETSADGAVRLRAVVGDTLPAKPGIYHLVIVVGEQGTPLTVDHSASRFELDLEVVEAP